MQECKYLAPCPFFNDRMKGMSATAESLKARYCRAQWAACARYQVVEALGPGTAPADLFPTQTERVAAIVAQGKVSPPPART